MAFTPQHFSDMIKLLSERPEWRRELRTLLFLDGEQDLPAMVQKLVEAQDRGEKRLERVEAALERLAEAQSRSEGRLDRVEAAIERLTEAQRRTEERVEELAEAQRRSEERLDRVEAAIERLAEAQRRTEERMAELAEAQRNNTDRIGDLVGRALEWDYERKAPAYFGSVLQRARVFDRQQLVNELESHLSEAELSDALLIDLVVRGIPRRQPEMSEVLLAIEISAVVDRGDVSRARRRATLLRKAGFKVIPVVAGEGMTEGAEKELEKHKVVLLQNGRVSQWEEALGTLSISDD